MNINRRRSSSSFIDPFASSEIYYGPETDPATTKKGSKLARARTMSIIDRRVTNVNSLDFLRRRASQDLEASEYARTFLISDVDETLKDLLDTEDTDKNFQITIEDSGPKVLKLGTANSNGFNKIDIRGTYMLSNLLQELTMAKKLGRNSMILSEERLNENPVKRLSRLITNQFLNNLIRNIDANNIIKIATDSKAKSNNPRIYIPYDEKEQYEYFLNASRNNFDIKLEVEYLPKNITPEWVKSVNDKPGLLALAMKKCHDPTTGETTLRSIPYVVPGGRFNEFYGWDSYMISLGLLVDNQIDLAKGMVEHFIFEINHYGKILNANRSYYLCRSQPPFLTDMALRVYEKIKHDEINSKIFLKKSIRAAIKEYKTVWCSEPRLDPISGLSRYRPDGIGIPPETESSHFIHLLQPYADKHGIDLNTFQQRYNDGIIKEPVLDDYFLNDRAVRESGHDTSYRLEKKCARLATIDLNSLLYKYEIDIAHTIRTQFNDKLSMDDNDSTIIEKSAIWDRRAKKRRDNINKYCWNEKEGMFFDYDTELKIQSDYESATTFWTMWAGVATPRQAVKLMDIALPKFEMFGGLVAGTEKSRGEIGLNRPNRQWDYPYGWAPQQILAWNGLIKYGYGDDAQRLIYRWLYLITKAFVDYNGIVVEKYDVTREVDPHRVDAEYGNQGADFKGVATEGFGWVNASYTYGLTLLNSHAKRSLGTCTRPDVFFENADTIFD